MTDLGPFCAGTVARTSCPSVDTFICGAVFQETEGPIRGRMPDDKAESQCCNENQTSSKPSWQQHTHSFPVGCVNVHNVRRYIANGYCRHGANYPKVEIPKRQKENQCEKVERIRQRVIVRFLKGHDRGRGSAVEQRVPKAQAKDSDHPSCSMVRLFVHVQNENVANANREGKQDCAGSQDHPPVFEDQFAEIRPGQVREFCDERKAHI